MANKNLSAAGEWYDASFDPELIAMRDKPKLCQGYPQTAGRANQAAVALTRGAGIWYYMP